MRSRCTGSGHGPSSVSHIGQFLGGCGPLYHSNLAAPRLHLRNRVRWRWNGTKSPRCPNGYNIDRTAPDHRGWAGSKSRIDQGIGHQWRRLLQCQFGSPVREPNCTYKSLGDLAASGNPIRSCLDVRKGAKDWLSWQRCSHFG